MLAGVSWLYALSVDKGFADAYKQFKQEYVEDMNERYAEERKVKQLMKGGVWNFTDNSIYFGEQRK